MLKISTRLFAAGTLAALLIGINQNGFASEKMAKSVAKTATKSCCVMKNGVMVCKMDAAASKKGKSAPAKAASKMTPKMGAKAAAVKTSAKAASKSDDCCEHPNAQPA